MNTTLKGLNLSVLSKLTDINHKRLSNLNEKESRYKMTQEEKILILDAIKIIEENIKRAEVK